jgi:hypothetical protein
MTITYSLWDGMQLLGVDFKASSADEMNTVVSELQKVSKKCCRTHAKGRGGIVEFYIDLDFISIYADSIGLTIEIPTWLLVGSIALVYSIRLIRNDK